MRIMMKKQGTGAPVVITGDDHWHNVHLLQHFDSDLSDERGNVVTNNGVTVSTTEKVFGTGAAYFTGSGSCSYSASGVVPLGYIFTVEFFVKPLSAPGAYNIIYDNRNTVNNTGGIAINYDVNGRLIALYRGDVLELPTGNGVLTWGEWHHVALVRNGFTLSLFVNGVKEAETTSFTRQLTNTSCLVGRAIDLSYGLHGYLDDFRITVGVARYSDNFAVPSQAFPNSAPVADPGYSTYPDRLVTTSNIIGLSSTATVSGTDWVVSDADGTDWKIAANFGYNSTPARWGGAAHFGAEDIPSLTAGNPGYVVNMNGNEFAISPGGIFSNASGPGFSNWYSDSVGARAYPSIVDAITNGIANAGNGSNADVWLDNSDPLDNAGCSMFWQPPTGTTEVMMDFANSHSNGPCSLVIWDNSTGGLVYSIRYGQFGNVQVSSSSLNDPFSRTFVVRHQPNYVYIHTDHGGTIAGSHYYLYR